MNTTWQLFQSRSCIGVYGPKRNVYTCPQEPNVENKENEKIRKYQQLAFELRIRNPGWKIYVYPLVIGNIGRVNTICSIVEKFFT